MSADGPGGCPAVYCGTESGDVVKLVAFGADEEGDVGLALQACAVVKRSPGGAKKAATAGKFSGGVGCMLRIKPQELLVGSGSGTVTLVKDHTDSCPNKNRDRKKKAKSDCPGTARTITEPTRSTLKEVRSLKLPGAVTSLCRLDKATVLAGCDSGAIFQVGKSVL